MENFIFCAVVKGFSLKAFKSSLPKYYKNANKTSFNYVVGP